MILIKAELALLVPGSGLWKVKHGIDDGKLHEAAQTCHLLWDVIDGRLRKFFHSLFAFSLFVIAFVVLSQLFEHCINSFPSPSKKPEKDKDNAGGKPDIDGLGVGDRGKGLLGLHALIWKRK